MHLHLNYSGPCSWGNCTSNGVFGEDPPLPLIQTVVSRAKDKHPNPDAIIVLGDFIEHDRDMPPDEKMELLKQTWTQTFNVLKTNFPGVPISTVFGNNDNRLNYQADDGDYSK